VDYSFISNPNHKPVQGLQPIEFDIMSRVKSLGWVFILDWVILWVALVRLDLFMSWINWVRFLLCYVITIIIRFSEGFNFFHFLNLLFFLLFNLPLNTITPHSNPARNLLLILFLSYLVI